MRKIILVIQLFIISCAVQAQLGIHVGGNGSFTKNKINPDMYAGDIGDLGNLDDTYSSWGPGFQVGVSYDIGHFFIFQPALFFQQKGSRGCYNIGSQHIASRSSLYYLEVPLNIMLKFKLGKQVKIFFGTGVTGSVGLFANSSRKIDDGKWQKEERYISTNNFGNLRRFDFGAQGFVGLQAFRFTFTVNYNNSFINMYGGSLDVRKNRVLAVNIGYRIGRDKEKKGKDVEVLGIGGTELKKVNRGEKVEQVGELEVDEKKKAKKQIPSKDR